MIKVQGLN